jgi:hypothetical protein
LNSQHGNGFIPETVEVIVIALPGAEDVHDDIAVIQQEPAGVQRALAVVGQDTILFQAQFDIIDDSADLSLAITGADNKKVRKATSTANVQQNDIVGLLIAGDFDRTAGYFDAFQSLNLLRFIS